MVRGIGIGVMAGLIVVGIALAALPMMAQEAPKPATPAVPAPAAAPTPAAPAAEAGGEIRITLWQQIKWGGWIGHTIILISIVAVAFIIDFLWKIRMVNEIPPDVVSKVQTLMNERAFNDVLATCKDKPCYFTQVIKAGLLKLRHDFSAVQEAVGAAVDKGGSELHGKINILSFIASIAPMLGLYGTVAGMIQSFSQLARASAQNKPELLAQGVSQALITTAEGLTVAIPVMFFYYFLRNRVNSIILEVESIAGEMFEPFRPTRKG